MIAKVLPFAFILLMLSGCSGSPSSPSSSTEVAGAWRIVLIQPALQPPQTAPAGATYEVTFEGSRVAARVDCNTCSGPYTVSGSSMTIGPLACTRAACPTAAFETAVVTLLSGEHRISTTGGTLLLDSSRGKATLARR